MQPNFVTFHLFKIGLKHIRNNLQGKKKSHSYLIDEAIELLNTEIRILRWRIQYPDQFEHHKANILISPLYLTDETTLINIMELISGLFLSKRLVYRNGSTIPLTVIGKTFEWLFNIKLGDYHQKHEDVIKRKPTKLTEFLNELATLIRKEHENKGYR